MATNLLDISKGHFTDIAIAKAARFLGENNYATYKAINFMLPALLGSMANKCSTSEGVNKLLQHVKESTKTDMSGPLANLMDGGTTSQNLMKMGRDVVGTIFENGGGNVLSWIATNANIKNESATSLLNMVAPILCNLIGKRTGASANSLANALNEQLPILHNASLPEGLLKAANIDLTAQVTSRVEDVPEKRMDFSKIIPWLLFALVIGAGIYAFKTCSLSDLNLPIPKPVNEKPAAVATQPVSPPVPAVVVDSTHKLTLPTGIMEIPKGSFLDKLYTEITDPKADLTKPLTLDSVYFKNASARLTPESKTQIDELFKIMTAYPTVEIRIDGHTDNFGIPDKNLRLSIIRAASVKRYLTQNAIDPNRIATQGFGDTKPIADNATPDGMAKNRRIEVYVTKR
jgi:OmpA-OmpF porin, OOP family